MIVLALLWIVVGVAYLFWYINDQVNTQHKTTLQMPPQVWWEYPMIGGLYTLMICCCFVYMCGCALLYVVSFGKIDVGDI